MASHHRFSRRSLLALQTVKPQLRDLATIALELSRFDFCVTCGIRTPKEQSELYKLGKTTTMKSKHLPDPKDGLASAIDFAVFNESGLITWDSSYYKPVIQSFFHASAELGIKINSGGLWKDFADYPHIELKG